MKGEGAHKRQQRRRESPADRKRAVQQCSLLGQGGRIVAKMSSPCAFRLLSWWSLNRLWLPVLMHFIFGTAGICAMSWGRRRKRPYPPHSCGAKGGGDVFSPDIQTAASSPLPPPPHLKPSIKRLRCFLPPYQVPCSRQLTWRWERWGLPAWLSHLYVTACWILIEAAGKDWAAVVKNINTKLARVCQKHSTNGGWSIEWNKWLDCL